MLRAALAASLIGAFAAAAHAQTIRAGKTASGIAYDVRGSGPVVVLLTGSNLDRRMWARETEWLSKSYTVVRYDLRAHGESDTATAEFSHLADLIGVFDALKIEKAALVGLSAGSAIALEAALDAPARVERIVLAGPAIGGFVSKVPVPFPPELMPAIQAREYRKVSEILLATPVFVFKAGPFAWNGSISFWMGTVVFGIWLMCVITFLKKATELQPVDEPPLD